MPTSGWTLIRFAWASHSLVIMLTVADKTLNSGCAQLGEAPQNRTPIVRFKLTQTFRLSCTTPPQMNLKVVRSGLPHETPQSKTWQGAPRFETSEPRFMLIGGVRGVPSEVHRMRSSSMGGPVGMHPHVNIVTISATMATAGAFRGAHSATELFRRIPWAGKRM